MSQNVGRLFCYEIDGLFAGIWFTVSRVNITRSQGQNGSKIRKIPALVGWFAGRAASGATAPCCWWWWLISSLLVASLLWPGDRFSSTAAASEAGAVSHSALWLPGAVSWANCAHQSATAASSFRSLFSELQLLVLWRRHRRVSSPTPPPL